MPAMHDISFGMTALHIYRIIHLLTVNPCSNRHKWEIAPAFLISALAFHYVLVAAGSGVTDGIGIIMLSLPVAALSPGAWVHAVGMTG